MKHAPKAIQPKPTTTVGHRRGVLERPRTVFLGDWSDDEFRQIQPLVGFSHQHPDLDDAVRCVPSGEMDLIVVNHPGWGSDHEWRDWTQDKFVVFFSTDARSELEFPHAERPIRHRCRHREYEVSADQTELAALARRSTVELADALGLPYWEREAEQRALRDLPIDRWLVRTEEGPCAFYSSRSSDCLAAGLLVVPEQLCQAVTRAEWLAGALRHWASMHPNVFPRVKTWREESAWWTAEQRRLESELAAAQTQFESARLTFTQTQARLARQSSEEAIRAEAAERRLLLSQGTELTHAASAAFERLGFTVKAPPEEETEAKAEDLLLSRADWLDWQASVEIKGFGASSAKTADAARIARRRDRRNSKQALLVVNGEFSLPASARHKPFEGNQESRDTLVELEVLVIDTRELYRALWDEQLGQQLVDAIRADRGVYSSTVVEE